MRLPLLAAARPRACKEGPIVPLPSGKWHIIHERLKDTILQMLISGVPLPTLLAAGSNGHFVDGPCNVQVVFINRGSEPYVNISAELQRGP